MDLDSNAYKLYADTAQILTPVLNSPDLIYNFCEIYKYLHLVFNQFTETNLIYSSPNLIGLKGFIY